MIAGAVGPVEYTDALLHWFQSGLNPDDFPEQIRYTDAQMLVLTKQRGIMRYHNGKIPSLHGHSKIAVGEGAPVAYGALYAGATLDKAVEAAIYYNPHCSGKPQSLSL